MNSFGFFCAIFLVFNISKVNITEAIPQDFSRIINSQRQGSIDEFLALRPSTPKPYEPCISHQFNLRRSKRSPHFKRQKLFPVNIYERNYVWPAVNSAEPSYNGGHGSYYCGSYKPKPPMYQPVYNNWLNFPIFGGIFGTNPNVVAASLPYGSNVKPVHEDNDHDTNPNEVWKYLKYYSVSF